MLIRKVWKKASRPLLHDMSVPVPPALCTVAHGGPSTNGLLKTLAGIAFELEGWEKEEYGVGANWGRESMSLLEESSKKMTARLQLPSDSDEGLKLKKG